MPPTPLSENVWLWLVVALCAFTVGLSKGGLGGTAVTLIAPALALFVPAPDAVGIALPMLMFGDVFALWAHWRGWDVQVLRRMLPPTVVGIVIGSVLLSVLPALTIRHGIGVFALAYCAYKLVAPRLRGELSHTAARLWHAPVFCSTAGLAATVANAGGPIADSYVLMQHLSPAAFIGTEALYFTLVNVLKLPAYLSTGALRPAAFLQIAWALPLVPVGVLVGKRLVHRANIRLYEWIIFWLLLAAGIVLLVR